MASTVKHLRSSTANKRPTASGLADGQLGINTASGTPGVFFKDSADTVVKVGPAHVGSSAPNATPVGSAGNSLGELWVNNSTTINGLNYYTGSAFVNLTPSGTTTVAGLVELATNAETQAGTDTIRAVTPSGLQSKISNSTSTTSSTTIASATAVKTAYDLANAALPKAGGRITGNLEIGPAGSLSFEGSSDDGFETTIAVVNPTADRIVTFPNVTGTVVTTGDSNTVTGTMIAATTITNAEISASAAIALSKLATGALPTGITIASGNIVDGTITDADINASAAIADTKLATISTAGKVSGTAITSGTIDTSGALQITNLAPAIRLTESGGTSTHSQTLMTRDGDQFLIQTRSSTGVFLSSDYLIPANASGATDHVWRIANTEKARLNSSGLKVVDDLIVTDKIIHDGDTNTAIRFPAADTIAFETNNAERARIDSSGRLLLGTSGAVSVNGLTAGLELHSLSTTNGASASITRFGNDTASGPQLSLGKSRSGTLSPGGIVQEDDVLGEITFCGDDGTDINSSAARIRAEVDGTPGTDDMPGKLVFSTTADGASSPTEALRITNDRVIAYNQAAPVAVNTSATITAADLKNGIITSTTAAAVTITLPTGTNIEAGFSGIYTNMTFEFSVINTGPSALTVGANSNTTVGSLTVAAGTSARYALRRTGTNAFTLYRLS